MRGRLIFPMIIELAQLDTDATAADPDGAGPLTRGYDDEFREPVLVPPSDTGSSSRGAMRRVETLVRVSAQLEDDAYEMLSMLATGRSPQGQLKAVIHFEELERRGMVGADGLPTIHINDRLAAVYQASGTLIQTIANPPGLFCVESQPRLGGLGGTRNLLLLSFEARQQSVAG